MMPRPFYSSVYRGDVRLRLTEEGIAGAVLEIVAAAAALAKGYVTEWNLPFGVPLFAWTVRLNALSAWFQRALSLLAAAVSVYSFG